MPSWNCLFFTEPWRHECLEIFSSLLNYARRVEMSANVDYTWETVLHETRPHSVVSESLWFWAGGWGWGVVPAHRDLACLIARRLICEQLLAPTSGHTTGEERWGWKSQSEKTQQSQSYYLRVIYLFLMWTILKVFIEFVAILFPFYVLILGWEACGILATWPGWLQD